MAEEWAPGQAGDDDPWLCQTSLHPIFSAANRTQKRSRPKRGPGENPGMPASMRLHSGSGGRTGEVFLLGRLQRSLTDATLWQVKRRVGRAWQTMLTLNVGKAFELIALIEPALGDLPAMSQNKSVPRSTRFVHSASPCRTIVSPHSRLRCQW